MNKTSTFCPDHPNQSITAVCLAKHCDQRALCPKCFHKVQAHSKYVVPIESLNNMSVFEKITETLNRENDDCKLFKKLDEEIDTVCDRVITACLTLINQQRNIMKKRLIENSPTSQKAAWEKFKEDLDEKLEACLNSNCGVKELNKYAKTVAKIDHKIKKEKLLSQERRGKLLFYYDEVNTLVQQLEASIGNLANTFIKSFDEEKLILDFKPENVHLVRQLETKKEIAGHAIDYIDDKNLIAIGDVEGNLSLWEFNSYKKIGQFKAHKAWICNVKYSQKFGYLFTSSQALEMKMFKLVNGNKLSLVRCIKETSPVHALLPLNHVNTLLSAGKGPVIKMWDLRTLTSKGVIDTSPNHGSGFQLLYLTKYNMIAAGHYNGVIALYDLKEKTEFTKVNIGQSHWHINAMTFAESKEILFAARSGEIMCWKLKIDERKLELIREVRIPEGLETLSMIPVNHERELICSSSSNKIYSLNVADGMFKEIKKTDSNTSYIKMVPKKRKMIVGLYTNKALVYDY